MVLHRRGTDDRSLRAWLPLAVAATPYWRAITEQAGMRPDDVRDLAALRRIPVVRELDLLRDDPAGATAVLAPTEARVQAHAPRSSVREVAAGRRGRGADGGAEVLRQTYRPLRLHQAGVHGGLLVAATGSDLERMVRAGARTAEVVGLADDDVVVSALRCGPTLAHARVVDLALGAEVTAAHPRAGDDLASVVAAVAALQPSVLVVARAEAVALAEALHADRVATTALRRVLLFGPPPDEAAREAIVGAFALAGASVGVRAVWAPSESRTLWAECAPGTGLHTAPDLEHLEVVDPLTGAPTDGDGDLVLTTVGWHGTVLLRYRTGAWVDGLTDEPCPHCGRTVPRVVGRIDEAAWQVPFTAAGRTRVVDLRGVAAALQHAPGVADWRVELRPPATAGGDDRLVVEVAGEPATDATTLTDRIAAGCGVPVEVVAGADPEDVVDEIARVGGAFADRR